MFERHTFDRLAPYFLIGAAITIGLYARPLLPVDETRYLSVAWDMHINGEWLVPHLNGEPYHHKPPLLFWIIRLLWLAFGVSEFDARLVAPIFGLGALALTQLLGRLLWPGIDGQKAGDYAALMVASASWWMVFSSLVMFDLMVAFFALLSWVGFAYTARHDRLLQGMAIVAVAIGGGILAKGPVILLFAVPAGLLAPVWASSENQLGWRQWYGGLLAAVLAGGAIGLAWAVPAALAGGKAFADNLLWGQTVNRLTNSFAHRHPMLWYVPLLPLILFPWSIWPQSWRALARKLPSSDRSSVLTILVPLIAFICFSSISGKQPQYLLPLFPLIMLAIARGLTSSTGSTKATIWPVTLVLAILATCLLLAPLIMSVDTRLRDASWSNIILQSHLPAGITLLGVAALCHWVARRGQIEDAIRACAVVTLGLFAAAHLAVFNPYLREAYDLHPISRVIAHYQNSGIEVAFAGDYAGEYNFYGRLQRPIKELYMHDVSAWAKEHPDGVVVSLLRYEPTPSTLLFSQPQRGRLAIVLPAKRYLSESNAPEPKPGSGANVGSTNR